MSRRTVSLLVPTPCRPSRRRPTRCSQKPKPTASCPPPSRTTTFDHDGAVATRRTEVWAAPHALIPRVSASVTLDKRRNVYRFCALSCTAHRPTRRDCNCPHSTARPSTSIPYVPLRASRGLPRRGGALKNMARDRVLPKNTRSDAREENAAPCCALNRVPQLGGIASSQRGERERRM